MLKSNPPYIIWSIWLYLPQLPKLVFVVVCVLGVYSLFSAAVTVARLRIIANLPNKGTASIQSALMGLRKRSSKLQQLIGAAFYLVGFVIFWGLQVAYRTIDSSRTPVEWIVLKNFLMYFAFAANVFFVLLIIHVIQWFASGRVEAYASRLNAPPVR